MPRRKLSDFLDAPASGTPITPAPVSLGSAAMAPSRALVPTQAPAAPGGPAAAPPGGTAALAVELNDVARALDVVAGVVASVSNRVDRQTQVLEQVSMNAAEARAAAFTARDQSNPGELASKVDRVLSTNTLPYVRELSAAVSELNRTAQAHGEARNRAEGQVLDAKRDLRAARADTLRWKGYLGGTLLGSLLLALLLAFFVVPPVLSSSSGVCKLGRGIWSVNPAGATGCTFRTPQ